MMPHIRNSFSNFEHPFKMFSSLLILMSQIQISHSKSRVPKPHFCWLPHTNEGNVGKQTSPPLPMVREGTDCECLLPVSSPFRIARLHCTLLLEPKILRWSTSYWIMVLLQMLLIRSINLCFFGLSQISLQSRRILLWYRFGLSTDRELGRVKKGFHVLLGRAFKTKKNTPALQARRKYENNRVNIIVITINTITINDTINNFKKTRLLCRLDANMKIIVWTLLWSQLTGHWLLFSHSLWSLSSSQSLSSLSLSSRWWKGK